MRNLIKGLAFTTGAYISYAATRAIQTAKQAKYKRSTDEVQPAQPAPAEAPSTTQLLHVDHDGSTLYTEDVPAPAFSPGEIVVTVNPFTTDYAYEDFDGTPLFYEIVSFSWDDTDRAWRYILDGEGNTEGPDVGFAESWLAKPKHPTFTKEWHVEDETKNEGDDLMGDNYGGMNWGDEYNGLGEAAARYREKKALAAKKDAEESRKYKIDCYLDLLAKGSEEDKAVALLRLTELSAENGGK